MEKREWKKFQLGLMTGGFAQKIKQESNVVIEEFVPGIYEVTKKGSKVKDYVDVAKVAAIMDVQNKCATGDKIYIHIGPFIVYNFHVEKDVNINDGLM